MHELTTTPATGQDDFLTLDHITDATPMGGKLLPSGAGATFQVWAPAAREVRVLWDYRKSAGTWLHHRQARLVATANGRRAGFVPGLKAGDRYMLHVTGPVGGTEGLKRDPYARDLTETPTWPECQCLLVDPAAFPWHDQGWRPPAFHELIIYQLHIGTWYIPPGRRHGTFLDVVAKLPYLKALGIAAIQPLPISEFPTQFSLGYNNVDPFSPETDYGVHDDDSALNDYLTMVNARLHDAAPGLAPYQRKDITGTAGQFRMLVDMCHVYGIAVLMDVVYNHAGGDFGDRSIYFLDRKPYGNHNDSLYFTDRGWAGGLVYAYWNNDVKQYLIDNAVMFLTECHCDGFRYDEVSVIRNEGGEHGWRFCQWLTDTCRYVKPEAIQIAEHWPVDGAVVEPAATGGAGFDAASGDGLRTALRGAVAQAASGRDAVVDMDAVAAQLRSPAVRDHWRAVQAIEDHDLVYQGRKPRIARLADGADARSWYARSRSRVALGLVLTAAGIPHLFMGQEFLEDKPWHDDPESADRIGWSGLDTDRHMRDFLRYTRELIALRRSLPALTASGIHIFHVHNAHRILAFHRWVPDVGQDVVIVASLAETTWHDYTLGFPGAGNWREVFNADVYDHWVNPWVAGNGSGVHADGAPLHGLPASARITIPANGIVVFAR